MIQTQVVHDLLERLSLEGSVVEVVSIVVGEEAEGHAEENGTGLEAKPYRSTRLAIRSPFMFAGRDLPNDLEFCWRAPVGHKAAYRMPSTHEAYLHRSELRRAVLTRPASHETTRRSFPCSSNSLLGRPRPSSFPRACRAKHDLAPPGAWARWARDGRQRDAGQRPAHGVGRPGTLCSCPRAHPSRSLGAMPFSRRPNDLEFCSPAHALTNESAT